MNNAIPRLSLFALGLGASVFVHAAVLTPLMPETPTSLLAGIEAARFSPNQAAAPPAPAQRAADGCPEAQSLDGARAPAAAPDAAPAEMRAAPRPERPARPQREMRWKALLPGALK